MIREVQSMTYQVHSTRDYHRSGIKTLGWESTVDTSMGALFSLGTDLSTAAASMKRDPGYAGVLFRGRPKFVPSFFCLDIIAVYIVNIPESAIQGFHFTPRTHRRDVKTEDKKKLRKAPQRRTGSISPEYAAEAIKLAHDIEAVAEKILESEEKYRTIFHHSPAAIAILDTTGRIVDLNDQVYSSLGYKPEEIIGRHILDLPLVMAKDRERLLINLQKRLEGEDIPPYEMEFSSKNGEKRVGTLVGTPLRNAKGAITGDIVILSDITHLKETEQKLLSLNEELLETNARLQNAYNWMRANRDQLRKQFYEEEMALLLDGEGRIEGVTEKAAERLMQPRSRLIGADVAGFLHRDFRDAFRRELKQAWKGIENWFTVEVILKKKRTPFDVRMTRITMEQKRLLLAVLR